MTAFVPLSLLIAALIIVIGFIANVLFEKKGIPDMLILIFLGIVFGPILGVFEQTTVANFAPLIAALALVFILFDGGMRMSLSKVFSHSPRAILLAIVGFVLSTLAVAGFMMAAVGVPLIYGLLFGSIFGGSSTIVIISISNKIKVSDKCSTTLILESAATDILCVVVSLAIIGIIITGQPNYLVIAQEITGNFAIGAMIGVVFGFGWLFLFQRATKLPFSYMLTLAGALFAYAISESLGGSGALSALLFGIMLGNETEILSIFRPQSPAPVVPSVDEGLKRFESEIAFLIRAFFFVFLGIIATITDYKFILLGISLCVVLVIVRYCAVRISTIKSELTKERSIMTVVLARGLAAAVLATLPAQYNLLYADIFVNLAVVVIIVTATIATIGVIISARKNKVMVGAKFWDKL